MSSISVRKIGITQLEADAVVNAANEWLEQGGGVCHYIFTDAGASEMAAACRKYSGCPVGGAVITPGFRLPAKYVIHAVGPRWSGGNSNESGLLYSAYEKSLILAKENGCRSIGFPVISSGIFGYPRKEAWEVALRACRDFIDGNPDYNIDIIFAVIDNEMLEIGDWLLKDEIRG